MKPHECLVTWSQHEVTKATPLLNNHISFLCAITRLADQENTINTGDHEFRRIFCKKISYEHRVVFHLVELILRGCQQTHVCLALSGTPQVASEYFHEVPQKADSQERTLENFSPEEYSSPKKSGLGLLDLHTDIRTNQKSINTVHG